VGGNNWCLPNRLMVMIKGKDVCNTSSTVPGKLLLPGNVSGDDGSDKSLYVKDCYPDQG